MISASKEFKEKLKSGANVVNYADITLSNGTVLHLEPKDFMIGGCSIEDKTTDGKFGVGFVIGKTLTIKIANHDERFSKYDFYQSIINLYVALVLDDGSIEKIRKGVYYTVVPETPGDIIEISAVDGMYRLDKDYASSTTVYPATLQKIITDVCLDCGIPIGFTQFDNMSYTVKEKPEKATYRQVMSWACQIAGYNARIDSAGYMRLIWYNTNMLDAYNYIGGDFKTYPHDTIVDGGGFKDYSANTIISGGDFANMPEHIFRVKSLEVHTDDVQITGVRVIGEDEKKSIFGEEGYLIEINGNPFVNRKESTVAKYLGQRMIGMVFRPFSAEILNNPLYEPFEVARVSDAKGNVYYTLINSISYKIGGYTSVACEAEDPTRNGSMYYSQAAQAVVEARRNVDKQISIYDKAVQNMNELAANTMGLFREQELQSDGSYIYFESTKPITVDENGICRFEPGSTVYKKQGEGFFVSRDGGLSYAAGFDSQGNAVLNVLYAIGIVCDWIRGGTLSLGGLNNTNGLLSILDDSGKQVGRWDKDGISVLKGIISGALIEVGGSDNSYGVVNIYDKNNKLCNKLSYDGMRLYNDGSYTGSIGTNYMKINPEMKSISFDLAHGQAFMGWGYQEEKGGSSVIKFAYYSPDQSFKNSGLYLGDRLFSNFFKIYLGKDDTKGYISSLSDGPEICSTERISFSINDRIKMQLVVNGLNLYTDLNMNNFSILDESDERLKENIEESQEPALEIINNIQTYAFDWIEIGKHEKIGFIAQQIEAIAPDLVQINKESDVYSINKVGLIPYLVKAVQELTLQVKELRKEVLELKGEKNMPYKDKKTKKEWSPRSYTDTYKKDFVNKLIKAREKNETDPIPIVEE